MNKAGSGTSASRTQLLKALLASLPSQDKSLRLLVACSGGCDSVALALAAKQTGYSVALAHVNHGLRGGESDQDSRFVQQLADQLGFHFHALEIPSEKWDQKQSIQAQARQFRYAFFESLLNDFGYDFCLLAHHQDDQAEQLLLSFFRGNQPRLFAPMPSRRDRFLRPFLAIPKSTCISALREAGQVWREDASNQSPEYLRNQVRLELMPALEAVFSSASSHLLDRAAWYEQQLSLLETLLDPWIEQTCRFQHGIHTCSWAGLPLSIKKDHLRTFFTLVLQRWGWHGHPLWQGAQLATAGTGAKVEWEGTLVRGREEIQWIPRYDDGAAKTINQHELPFSGFWAGRLVQMEWVTAPETLSGGDILLDSAALNWPLELSGVQKGDKMAALGMKGAKLLSDVMIDSKYSPAQKWRAVTLRDASGQVLWLSDFRIAEAAKITPGRGRSLRLVIEPAD